MDKTFLSGYVYIAVNESFSDQIKVGKTSDDLDKRMKSLDNTNLPTPFDWYAAIYGQNFSNIEKFFHSCFDNYGGNRTRKKREFFNVDKDLALQLFEHYVKANKTCTLLRNPKFFPTETDDNKSQIQERSDIYKEPSAPTQKSDRSYRDFQKPLTEEFFLKNRKGANGKIKILSNKEFIILKGSKRASENVSSDPNDPVYSIAREYGWDGSDILNTDITFPSPSALGRFMYKLSSCNGWMDIETNDGQTLDDYLKSL